MSTPEEFCPKENEPKKTKIAIVNTGGYLHGFRQMGVWAELQQLGIQPDLVVGVSVSAYLGTILATRTPLSVRYRLLQDWSAESSIPKNLKTNHGMYSTHGGMGIMQGIFSEYETFEDLPVKFAVVATDVETKQPKVFSQGPLWSAVEASLAHPFFYPPVERDGRFYKDGGLSNPAPLDVVKEFGDDYATIFVNTYSGVPAPLSPQLEALSPLKKRVLELLPEGNMYNVGSALLRYKELLATVDGSIETLYTNFMVEKLKHHPPDVHIDVNALLGKPKIDVTKESFRNGASYIQQGEQAAKQYTNELLALKKRMQINS